MQDEIVAATAVVRSMKSFEGNDVRFLPSHRMAAAMHEGMNKLEIDLTSLPGQC